MLTDIHERVQGLYLFHCQLNADHLGISVFVSSRMKRLKVSRYVYNFRQADITGSRNTLLHTPFDIGLNNINNIDQSWENW